jgi:hypothetical protein
MGKKTPKNLGCFSGLLCKFKSFEKHFPRASLVSLTLLSAMENRKWVNLKTQVLRVSSSAERLTIWFW